VYLCNVSELQTSRRRKLLSLTFASGSYVRLPVILKNCLLRLQSEQVTLSSAKMPSCLNKPAIIVHLETKPGSELHLQLMLADLILQLFGDKERGFL